MATLHLCLGLLPRWELEGALLLFKLSKPKVSSAVIRDPWPFHHAHLFCAGNSKLVIQSLTVRDATGALGAAAGTGAGMILTPWNPDESWTHDALVQVSAVLKYSPFQPPWMTLTAQLACR